MLLLFAIDFLTLSLIFIVAGIISGNATYWNSGITLALIVSIVIAFVFLGELKC